MDINDVVDKKNKRIVILTTLLCILLLHYPLTFGLHPLKWDAIDITLASRHFLSQCLRHHLLPLWNPYQFLGFPYIHISDTWYIPSMVLSYIFPYNSYLLNIEYLFHILLAFYGFYRLLGYLNCQFYTSIIVAFAFANSGYFTGNAQHMGWVIAGAWLPLVFFQFLSFLKGKKIYHFLSFQACFFLFVSGSYPPFIIICTYLLIGVGLWQLVSSNQRLKTLRLLFSIAAVAVLLNAFHLKNFLFLSTSINRSTGLSLIESTEGSLLFRHLHSLVFSWPTIYNNSELWLNDQSMINCFISIPLFIISLISLRYLRNPKISFFWLMVILFFGLSFGQELALRKWANILPGFRYFRYPSLFRYFAMSSLLILAAFQINQWINRTFSFSHKRALLIISLIFTLTTIALWSINSTYDAALNAARQECLIGMGFSWLAFLIVHYNMIKKWLPILTISTLVSIAMQLFHNSSTSIYDPAFSTTEIDVCIQQLPSGFSIPPGNDPVGSNVDKSLQFGPIYRNTNTYFKRVSADGYTPYQLNGFNDLEKSEFLRHALAQDVFFWATKPSDHLKNGAFEIIPIQQNGPIDINQFLPGYMILEVENKTPSMLVFNQNFMKNWKAEIDAKSVEIFKCGVNLMGINVPLGIHRISFKYHGGSTLNALIISGCLFIFIFIFWLFSMNSRLVFLISGITIVILGINYIYLTTKKTENQIITHFDSWDYFARPEIETSLDFPCRLLSDQYFPNRTLEPSIITQQRFDEQVASWAGVTNLIWEDHLNYQKSQLLDSLHSYSATFEKSFPVENNSGLNIEVEVKNANNEVFLVASGSINGQSKFYYNKPLASNDVNRWSKFNMDIPAGHVANTTVKIYVWNKSKKEILVDNFTIRKK